MDILSALRKVTASIKTWADSKLETKLDKNLGTDNAGKVLTIGDDGDIKSQMLDTGIIVLSGTNDNPINIDEIKVSGTYLIKGVVTTSMDTTSGSDSAKLNKTFIDGFARGELMSIYSLQDGFVNQLMMNPTRPLVRLDSGEGYSDAIDASYVQPVEKTTEMTQPVGIRSDGQLFTEPFNQVQSDWNENDETNPAYIKNRTHYDSRTEVVLLSSAGENVIFGGFGIKISDEVMTEDKLISARVELSCSTESLNVDNASFIYDGNQINGPTVVYSYYNEELGIVAALAVISTNLSDEITSGTYFVPDIGPGSLTYSMKLYGEVGELKTLDPKYIKDMYYTDGITEVTLLDGTFDFVEIDPGLGLYRYFQEGSPFILEEGKTYTVVFDGTSYSCICYYLDGDPTIPAIGNASFWGSTGGNDEPFYIDTDSNELYINTKLTDASHTVKITSSEENIKKLDAKYLPDEIRTTPSSKMDKENPTGTGSFSLNRRADTAIGDQSFAEGANTTASGHTSHAEGYGTTASGINSHAEGQHTTASGSDSHAEGTGTTASDTDSHAEGYYTTALGKYSHAEGNSANKFSSVVTATNPTNAAIITAWKRKKFSLAKGASSHVEGNNSLALGGYSHAEGFGTTASGDMSHTEGFYTTVSGVYSHAEGNYTTASGSQSHAEGWNTTVSGNTSHAEGFFTKASGPYQHTQGRYNVEDSAGTYADIIGNGTSSKRSNAATVDWSGNAWYAGDVYVGSTSGTNKDAGSKKLATEEYVNSAVSEIPSIPTALPNPYALTFTGAVTGSYDGSQAVTVEIPSGGSGSDAWNLIDHFTTEAAAISYAIPLQSGAKEYGIYWKYTNSTPPQRNIMVDGSLATVGVMYRCSTNDALFLRVYKGPSNILVAGQNTVYSTQRFTNGGTYIGSGTDFPAMTLTTNTECATSEIWVYWR